MTGDFSLFIYFFVQAYGQYALKPKAQRRIAFDELSPYALGARHRLPRTS